TSVSLHSLPPHDALPILDARLAEHNVTGCEDPASAFANADLVFSLVFADRAYDAAVDTARHLQPGAFYVDGNSCSPQTKARAARSEEHTSGLQSRENLVC